MIILRRSQLVEVEKYALVFEWQDLPGAGFSFPCDKEGTLLLGEVPVSARGNLQKCLRGEYAVTSQGVKNYSYTYFQPAQGRCACGRIVELFDPMTNSCDCGRLYNGCGQSLVPRDQWEEPWDED